MSRPTKRPFRLVCGVAAAALVVLTGCTSNASESDSGSNAEPQAVSANDDPGETVTIGFSGPAADHGWLAAINSSAQE